MSNFNKYIFSTFAIFFFSIPEAVAQDSDENVEEVVVTGSRITNPNIVSTSQVQVVTAADIENRGAVRIEEVLNDLPQIAPGQIAQTAKV